jgi:hypothetical protein
MQTKALKIIPARPHDLPRLLTLLPVGNSSRTARQSAELLRKSMRDQSLLLAIRNNQAVASAAVDLDHAQLAQWTAESALTDIHTANALLSETERLAVRFGIQELTVKAQAEAQNLLRSHGYRPATVEKSWTCTGRWASPAITAGCTGYPCKWSAAAWHQLARTSMEGSKNCTLAQPGPGENCMKPPLIQVSKSSLYQPGDR